MYVESYRDMSREVLQILNESDDLSGSIQRVLEVIKHISGFDAVGIRLRNGDDFPYLYQKGFPADFLLKENSLLERASDGGLCRNMDGSASLECTCGLVLSGKADPANPLFTPGGSCWTNDSFTLLALPPGEDPRHHPRNHCIHQGFASVALVPIRNKEKIVGLIQLNDRSPGRFTREKIELLEEISSHIGAALLRKQAENETLRSRDYYLSLFESFPALIWRSGIDTLCNYFNKTWLEFTGRTLEQELGNGWTEGVHPEDMERCLGIYLEAFNNRQSFFMEYRLRHHDGAYHWIADYGRPYYDLDGVFAGYLGSCYDLSTQKQSEQALRESEQRYRTLVDNIPIGITQIDRNQRIIMVNRAQAQWFGQTPEWFVGRHCFTEFEGRDTICPHCSGLTTMETGSPGMVYKDGRRPDGSHFSVSIRTVPIHGPEGETTGFIEVVEDITERMRAEEALRQSEERFRQLFEQNDDAIVLVDRSTLSIFDSNRQMEKLFGYSREKLVRGGLSLLFPKKAKPDLHTLLQGISNSGSLRIDKTELLRKDRAVLFVSIRCSIITLPHGEVGCLSFRDISEKIRMEEEAQATQAKLIQIDKMSSLGLLVSGIAHEINNPNNFIMSNSESLAKVWQSAMPILEGFYREFGDFNLGGFQFSSIREIAPRMFSGLINGSLRIRDIVEKLKDFARQESGDTNSPVDINTTILEAINILNHEIKKSCENFEMDTGYNLPPVRGNARQIEQVIINLLMNALQALPDRTCAIRITSRTTDDRRHLVINIEDEGVGMSPEVMARVTEPFFTTKGEKGGTGLGLSISASILKENHGTLSFTSVPGRGTTATLLFQVFGPQSQERSVNAS